MPDLTVLVDQSQRRQKKIERVYTIVVRLGFGTVCKTDVKRVCKTGIERDMLAHEMNQFIRGKLLYSCN
jgi:hypothetical protein